MTTYFSPRYLFIYFFFKCESLNVLQEAQGFSRTKRNSRLVYDYKDCSQGTKNNSGQVGAAGSPRKRNEALPEVIGTMEKQDVRVNTSKMNSSSKFSTTSSVASSVGSPPGSSRFNENRVRTTPEKKLITAAPSLQTTNVGNNSNNTRGISKYGYSGSPKSSIKQSPGSVLSKASMFESRTNSNFVKVKDPAEMSLSERKALFERNKGEALIPKAPLTMSVPTKKLMEKEKHTAGNWTKLNHFFFIFRKIFT